MELSTQRHDGASGVGVVGVVGGECAVEYCDGAVAGVEGTAHAGLVEVEGAVVDDEACGGVVGEGTSQSAVGFAVGEGAAGNVDEEGRGAVDAEGASVACGGVVGEGAVVEGEAGFVAVDGSGIGSAGAGCGGVVAGE